MQGTITTKDFLHKASISLKELKESRMNIKILNKVGYGETSLREKLLDEVDQLIRIVATIIKNKQQ